MIAYICGKLKHIIMGLFKRINDLESKLEDRSDRIGFLEKEVIALEKSVYRLSNKPLYNIDDQVIYNDEIFTVCGDSVEVYTSYYYGGRYERNYHYSYSLYKGNTHVSGVVNSQLKPVNKD